MAPATSSSFAHSPSEVDLYLPTPPQLPSSSTSENPSSSLPFLSKHAKSSAFYAVPTHDPDSSYPPTMASHHHLHHSSSSAAEGGGPEGARMSSTYFQEDYDHSYGDYDEPVKDGHRKLERIDTGKSGLSTRGGVGAGPVGDTVKKRRCASFRGRNRIGFMSLIVFQSFAVLSLLSLIYATIVLSIGDFKTTLRTPSLEAITTYLALYSLAMIFEIVISVETLITKNIIQVLALIFLQAALVTYTVFLPRQVQKALYASSADTINTKNFTRIYAWSILGVVSASTLGLLWYSWKLSTDFGWAVLKTIGADYRTKKMYAKYQILLCLIKFDFFFSAGFAIQFLVLVQGSPLAERVITYASIGLIPTFLVLAAVALRYENKWGMGMFLLAQLGGIAYFVFKLFRIYGPDSVAERYMVVRKTLAIFSGISIFMLLLTFIMSIVCWLNFGKGLKDKIPPYWTSKSYDEKMEEEKFTLD